MKRPADLPHGGFEFYEDGDGKHSWTLWAPRGNTMLAWGKQCRRPSEARKDATAFVRLVEECGAMQLNVLPLGPQPRRSIALDAPKGVQ